MRCRRPLVLTSLVAVTAFALLAASCGGSGGGGSGGGAGSPGAAAITTSTTAATGTQNTALAFARCMRSHGLPNWPDPTSGGVFDKSKLRQTGYSVSQVRAVEDGACHHLLPSGPPQGPTITAADRTDYLKAAAGMRAHGYPYLP